MTHARPSLGGGDGQRRRFDQRCRRQGGEAILHGYSAREGISSIRVKPSLARPSGSIATDCLPPEGAGGDLDERREVGWSMKGRVPEDMQRLGRQAGTQF